MPNWVTPGAVNDADFEGDRYYFNRSTFADLRSYLAASGGQAFAKGYTWGPYDVPDSSNHVVGGDMAVGVNSWLAIGSAELSVISGEMVVSSVVPNDGFYQQIAGIEGYGLRLRGKGRRGTTLAPTYLRGGSAADLNSSAGSASTSGTSAAQVECEVPCYPLTYIGVRNQGTGTSVWDDIVGSLLLPTPATTPGDGVHVIDFDAPSSFEAEQIIWQQDNGTDRSCVALLVDTSGRVRVRETNDLSETLNFDLGTVLPGTRHAVAYRGTFGAHFAAMDGRPPLISLHPLFPSPTRERTQADSAGNRGFGNALLRKTYIPGSATMVDVTALSARRGTPSLWIEGDSYVAGVGGASLATEVRNLGRSCASGAVSGATIYQTRDRVVAESARVKALTLVVWDGSPAGYLTVGEYLDALAIIADEVPHGRFIFLPPVRRLGQTPQERADTMLIQAAIASKYPENYFDAQSAMVAMAVSLEDEASVAAGCVPLSTLQEDGLHPTVETLRAISSSVVSILAENEW